MVSKGRCIAADRQSASRECISPARSQNICIVCVSVIRGPGEETQTINGGQMVERRREASVCVCGGGDGGGRRTGRWISNI